VAEAIKFIISLGSISPDLKVTDLKPGNSSICPQVNSRQMVENTRGLVLRTATAHRDQPYSKLAHARVAGRISTVAKGRFQAQILRSKASWTCFISPT
jgi:hypothetical protein